MGYKLIKSMIHNFNHSFVSNLNFFDEEYVLKDLLKLAREREGEVIEIEWIPHRKKGWENFNARIRKSIEHYLSRLPNHMRKNGVSENLIAEMRTEICKKSARHFKIEAFAIDDRGKEYRKNISFLPF